MGRERSAMSQKRSIEKQTREAISFAERKMDYFPAPAPRELGEPRSWVWRHETRAGYAPRAEADNGWSVYEGGGARWYACSPDGDILCTSLNRPRFWKSKREAIEAIETIVNHREEHAR